MLTTLWSAKGGSGVTVCALAAARAASPGTSTLVVDLQGDVPAAAGVPEPSGAGLSEWTNARRRPPEALARLVVPLAAGVALLPRGADELGDPDSAAELAAAVRSLADVVLVDAGAAPGGRSGRRAAAWSAALVGQGRSVMVVRPCYLELRRAVRCGLHVDGLVVVAEPGRSLDHRDACALVGAPLLAHVAWDPSVARSVDAGLLLSRPARRALRPLARVLP